MPSLKSRLLYHVVKYQLAKLGRLQLPLPEYRLAREAAATRLFRMPSGVTVQAASLGACDGEWLHPGAGGGAGVVLYLHGGAYTGGSCVTHRALAARLAQAANSRVFNLAYRLAPEHPFPAALDDAVAAYAALGLAYPGTPIAISGDSAGAGLALSLAISLRDRGMARPAALALMSPWTDLALSHGTHITKAAVDPYFPSKERLQVAAAHYAGATGLRHPLVSPHYADVHQLPPTLIHVGTLEALLDDSLLLAERMNAQGSSATVRQFPGMWHVWQTLHGRMVEADQSLEELGAFMGARFGR
jgi:acetyl esterase/lipase